MSQFCPQCGKELVDDANFCTSCGFKLHDDVSILASKSRIEAEIDSNYNYNSNYNSNNKPKSINNKGAMLQNNVDNSLSQSTPQNNSLSQNHVMSKKEEKVHKLESKFGVDLTNNPWFQCTLEELRESTFTNETRRDVNTGYVIIYDDYIEIIKESVFIKSDMGHRKVYFENISSIDYDKRGKLHLSNSVMINTKSVERPIQLKYVMEKDYNLLVEYFEKYLKNKNIIHFNNSSNSSNNDFNSNSSDNVDNLNNIEAKQFISPADELMKYAQLYKDGFLTKEEFEAKKKELL